MSIDQPSPSKLQTQIAAQKAKRDAEAQSAPVASVKPVVVENRYSHLAPEADYEPDPYNELLDNVSILDAYRLWCGKMTPTVRPGQTESIMVSCPTRNHNDSNPSAWVNTANNTWYCGSCQLGGDCYDIASEWFEIRNYKQGLNYGKLRKAMAESLGYGVATIKGKDIPYLRVVPDVEPAQPETPAPLPIEPLLAGSVENAPVPAVATLAVAIEAPTNEQLDAEIAAVLAINGEEQLVFPTLDWRAIVAPGTFLSEYMDACCIDDIAEEYHFWNGLLGLGFVAGRDTYLRDSPNVFGNLFICLLGLTGDGKSRSMRHLRTVLANSLPFDFNAEYPKGVNLTPTPSSAEALITMFTHAVYDPVNPKLIVDYASIRGLVEFGELSELTGKANRMGNTLKPTLIDLYDMKNEVSTMSVVNGVKKAKMPFCSMFTSTQPDSLKEILGKNDKSSGFLNRWVFASGKPKKRSFFQEDIVDLSGATDALQRTVGWVGFGKEITVDEDATDLMERFYSQTVIPVLHSEDSGMLSRLPLLYKKLLLLIAINEHSSVITGSIAEKVISTHGYMLDAYKIPTSRIGADDITNVYNAISEYVKAAQTRSGEHGPTLGQIKRSIKSNDFSIKMISDAMRIMENLGEIETYAVAGKGRPTIRYRWTGTA